MRLFAIADLHLSFGLENNKSMEIFKGFENHIERLRQNWNNTVGENDTVVIAGDISWAISLETATPDFVFIDRELNGKKIIIKGNHDYWWTSLSKMNEFSMRNNLHNISFLHNNAFLVDNIAVCGTRGWLSEKDEKHGEKLQKREAARLEASIMQAKESFGENISQTCVFLHYPPIYGDFEDYYMIEILQKYSVTNCFYGHLHGIAHKKAVLGECYGVEFSLISADFVDFKPVKIEK